jgi:hypothetical protein
VDPLGIRCREEDPIAEQVCDLSEAVERRFNGFGLPSNIYGRILAVFLLKIPWTNSAVVRNLRKKLGSCIQEVKIYSTIAKPENVAKPSNITFFRFIPSALSKKDHDHGI